ncbi:MAG: protein-L-isoaspartate O-methyltransferase [Kiloniellales bacterium]
MDYAAARLNMVESQLRTNRVSTPALIEAFETVPRERFLPESMRGIAYIDEDLPLGSPDQHGGGRHLMEPMVLARLLQAAAGQPGDVVLEIGSGSGYAAAILARLAATVVALESDPELARQANALLNELGADNAVVVTGPLGEGYPKQAPYNVILIDGAVSAVPKAISDQLADGGRLVAVVKEGVGLGRAILAQRSGDHVAQRVLFDAATPYLPEFEAEPGFVF